MSEGSVLDIEDTQLAEGRVSLVADTVVIVVWTTVLLGSDQSVRGKIYSFAKINVFVLPPKLVIVLQLQII